MQKKGEKRCDSEQLLVREQKEKSLDLSIKEGAAASVMTGTGNNFIIPFALALNSSSFQIGFLSSFSSIIGPISQLFSSHLMERYSRKKIVIVTVLLQALLWLPMIFLGAMFYFNFWLDSLPYLLILFYSLHIGIGAIASPPWFSWMGDLVPERKRGDYFAKRNRITNIVALIAMLAGGFALDYFKTQGLVLLGFTILFSIALFARVYSVLLFRKHYYPDLKLEDGYYFSFLQFLRKSFSNNFGVFSLFVGFMHFAVMVASPFISVYMLQELEFSYVWFTLITISQALFTVIFLYFWGKISDKYGNRIVINVCGFLVALVPILWMLSTSKVYLLLVPSLVAGLSWGGFSLASSNFIYDSVSKDHRALAATYYNVLLGAGMFVGPIVGGTIIKYSQIKFMNIFLFVFLISGILRFLIALVFLPNIKEVRRVKKPNIFERELHIFHGFKKSAGLFNSSIIEISHLPNINSKKLIQFGRIFTDRID